MIRLSSVLAVAGSTLLAFADDPKKQPITADPGEVGKLLKKWHAEGTAAGNAGDWYDNRDGEHSPLDLRPWPQLRKVQYSDDDVTARRNWAFMPATRPHVTFGNSSTSAPPELSGSNPRSGYSAHQPLAVLEKQYLGNNLYIYPEHRDHDPGHNGVGDGYGDLFPTNSPYLLVSQGSSGSDQPFMRAVPFALAAFRPDVKKKLAAAGLLMPAVQMILRRSNKGIDEKSYLTGKAHPSVFEGGDLDPVKMVTLAHSITADDVPPLVKLRVTREDAAENGKDFFDLPHLGERHSDTSCVVARVWRAAGQSRTLTVSAEGSIDLNEKPLTFTWALLRGDPKRVALTPKDGGRSAEIRVEYHERRPIATGSKMESNRVDIGVFAHNGKHYSAPAFVTFFSLDSEARTYEKGKPVEIGYGMGEAEVKVTAFGQLLSALGEGGGAAKALGVKAGDAEDFARLGREVRQLEAGVALGRADKAKAQATRDKAKADVGRSEKLLAAALQQKDKDAAKADLDAAKVKLFEAESDLKLVADRLAKAEAASNAALDSKHGRPFVLAALAKAVDSPKLWDDHGKGRPARPAVTAAKERLAALGVARFEDDGSMTLTPARGEKGEPTAYERAMLRQFNAAVLAEVLSPSVSVAWRPNYVDARLSAVREWRDVYRPDGGWVRHSAASAPADFTPEGWLVVAKDDKGRPTKAVPVTYGQAPPPKGTRWGNPNPLKYEPGEGSVTFAYEGERRVIKERLPK